MLSIELRRPKKCKIEERDTLTPALKYFLYSGLSLGLVLATMFFENPRASRYFLTAFLEQWGYLYSQWFTYLLFFAWEFFFFIHMWLTGLFYLFYGLLSLVASQFWMTTIQ